MAEAKSFGIKNLMQLGTENLGHMEAVAISDIAASSPEERDKFIKSLMKILNQYQFDGVYLFWKYPGCPGVRNT
jgi:GH18 family chitinase